MMFTAPRAVLRPVLRPLRIAGRRTGDGVRRQFITRNRRVAFVLAVIVVGIALLASHLSVYWFPPALMILPLLCGGLLLWPRALRILVTFAAVGIGYDVLTVRGVGPGVVVTVAATAYFADVLSNTRGKLGTRGLRADRMMIEL